MKTIESQQFSFRKSATRVALVMAAVLMIPLVAMQFTGEVDWSLSDFVVAGILLFGTGMGFVLLVSKVIDPVYRAAAIVALAVLFLLVWAELAVGIIGSPFAGS